jgi:predicted RNA-binding Zn-ribbon protein involved in translation (DUF1610 family)
MLPHVGFQNELLLVGGIDMPVSISCTGCGKMLTVRDELIGKRIKCPQCGERFTAAQAAAQTRQKQADGGAGNRIHISPGVIMLVAVVILIPGTFAIWKLGPGKIKAQWSAMESHASDNVGDVVDRALQSYLSQHGQFDSMIAHSTPHMHEVHFVISPMPWSMPQWVGFIGLTTEGAMGGRYNPNTGEVEANVEVGGKALPGVLVRRGNTTLTVTGQVKDGNVTVNVNGAPADVKWPTPGKRYL